MFITGNNSGNKSLYSSIDLRTNLCHIDHLDFSRDLVEKLREQAKSIACLVNIKYFNQHNQLDARVPTLRGRARESGCTLGEGERFGNEPSCGSGTAFLIGDQLALTAAHCVCNEVTGELNLKMIQSTCLIFDFNMNVCEECPDSNTNVWNRDFSQGRSYRFTVIAHKLSRLGNWEDWAILKLDRKVEGRTPLDINFTAEVALSDKVYMLGHLGGLPLKHTANAEVMKHEHKSYFEANLDAFRGHSGSPVFLLETHKVAGMLFQGNSEDFDIVNGIARAHRVTPEEIERNGYEKCYKITALTFLQATLPSIDIPNAPAGFFGHIKPGLNVEGKCTNVQCRAGNRVIIIPKGFGFFDMNAVCCETNCPACSARIDYDDINRIVLQSCQYKIDGMNSLGQRITETLRVAPGHEYNFDIQHWKFLELTIGQ